MKRNVNCLKGLRCPQCRQADELLVWAEMCVSLTDDGTDPYADSTKNHGGVEWNENSVARCPACGFEGTMHAFEIAAQRRGSRKGARRSACRVATLYEIEMQRRRQRAQLETIQ